MTLFADDSTTSSRTTSINIKYWNANIAADNVRKFLG